MKYLSIKSTEDCPAFPEIEGVQIRHIPEFLTYAAGDDGSIWSCHPYANQKRLPWWRRLKTSVSNGYRRVALICGTEKHSFYVASLVLKTFIGRRPEGHEVCHWDGTRTNDHLSNLRWGTRADNVGDAIRHGTAYRLPPMTGERHPQAKLTNADVVLIRILASFLTQYEIADLFEVTQGHINNILCGRLRRAG